ncbi:hypothetical protein BVG19_g4560 [[Candida] boidinii]|nr:hypothetical protein BVG19_g4560 [[Candida] boidinii]OWB53297.1 peptidase activity protein [[Candida] boidinii]OWB82305.1 peptidase activity protein [[Candida] boidinii]
MNNKIVFSSSKGYHLPNLNKESPTESIIQNKKIVTFGFDFFNWGNDIDIKPIEEIEQDSNHTDHDEDDEDDNTGNNEDDNTGNNQDEDENGEDGDEVGEDGDDEGDGKDDNEDGDLEDSKDEISDTKRKKIKNSNKLNNKKVNKNIKSGKKVKLSKDERKEARKLKKQFKKDKKNRKAIEKLMISNGNNSNFYIPNDINEKILNLKQIYKEILKILENKNNNSNNSNIVTIEDISLNKEDLYNFLEDEWLNDNNIAFIYELLLKYQIKPILNKKYKFPNKELVENTILLLMPTFTFLLMHSTDPNLLKGVLPPIEKSKFIFLPVNDNEDLGVGEGGSHWSLLLISLVDNTAIIYDSMLLANETETLKLIKNLEVYLGVKLKVINDDQTPQQINGNDCGLLVIINSIILLNRILNVPNDTYLNLNLHNLLVNAVDGRLFIMNLVKIIVSKDNKSKLLTLHL